MTCTPRTPESINPGAVQAGDYLERMVSVYRNSFDTKGEDRTLRSVLEEIRDSKLSHLITEVRQLHQAIPPLPKGLLPDDTKGITKWKAEDPETHALWHAATRKYSAVKRKLAAFILVGTFRPYHRHGETPTPQHLQRFPDCSSTGLREQTGIVVLDLDHLEAHGAGREHLLEQFADHPAVVGGYSSPSDDGLKVFVAVHPVPWDDDSHVKAWAAAKDVVADIYSDVDESGKIFPGSAAFQMIPAAASHRMTSRSHPCCGNRGRSPIPSPRRSRIRRGSSAGHRGRASGSRTAIPASSNTRPSLPWSSWLPPAAAMTTHWWAWAYA